MLIRSARPALTTRTTASPTLNESPSRHVRISPVTFVAPSSIGWPSKRQAARVPPVRQAPPGRSPLFHGAPTPRSAAARKPARAARRLRARPLAANAASRRSPRESKPCRSRVPLRPAVQRPSSIPTDERLRGTARECGRHPAIAIARIRFRSAPVESMRRARALGRNRAAPRQAAIECSRADRRAPSAILPSRRIPGISIDPEATPSRRVDAAGAGEVGERPGWS